MTRVSVAGHFGEWMQGCLGPEGPVVLVTLACPVLRSHVDPRGDRDASDTAQQMLDTAQLARFRALLGVPVGGPPFDVTCDMPLGGGAGSSTAALVGLARASGFDGTPDALAQACLAMEGASDPLMYPAPDALLWASREGRIVAQMTVPPRAEIVGGFWGAPERTDPSDMRFAGIADLVAPWRSATAQGDLRQVAHLAGLSADRTTRLRGPQDPMAELARDLGALGYMRAHTGSARGVIFAPGSAPRSAEDALREAGLSQVLRFETGRPR